jgi:hypothetical protein
LNVRRKHITHLPRFLRKRESCVFLDVFASGAEKYALGRGDGIEDANALSEPVRLGSVGARSVSSGSRSRYVGINIGVRTSSSDSSCFCFRIMKESE